MAIDTWTNWFGIALPPLASAFPCRFYWFHRECLTIVKWFLFLNTQNMSTESCSITFKVFIAFAQLNSSQFVFLFLSLLAFFRLLQLQYQSFPLEFELFLPAELILGHNEWHTRDGWAVYHLCFSISMRSASACSASALFLSCLLIFFLAIFV